MILQHHKKTTSFYLKLPQQQPDQKISEQEYLDGELLSEVKHEFIDGSVYAMAGASADHGRIAGSQTEKTE